MASSHYAFLASVEHSNSPEETQNIGITMSGTGHQTSLTTACKYYYGDHSHIEQYAHKLEEFKNILTESNSSHHDHHRRSLAALTLVDAVLRLGIEYHFQEEIEDILLREYLIFLPDHNDDAEDCNNIINDDQELHEVALRFRLLRQGGYQVSADVFNKFKDAKGKFNPALAEDKEGLMQLFEASQLSIEEEHILEEAEDFSRYHLSSWLNRLEHDGVRTMIVNTLEQPYHKSLARLMARNINPKNLQGIVEYWGEVLEQVAKVNFRIVQSIHHEEIVMISGWWEELGLAKELKFARNQPLKWYLWTVATLADPSLSDQRIELTKPISLVYIIDDIFDVYGTLDELSLFTDVVNKYASTTRKMLYDSV